MLKEKKEEAVQEFILPVPEQLTQETGAALLVELKRQLPPQGGGVALDLTSTVSMDTPGGACLLEMSEIAQQRGGAFRVFGQQGMVADLLSLMEPALASNPRKDMYESGFFENLGEKAFRYTKEGWEFFDLAVDAFYWTLLAPFEGRGFRFNLFIDEIHEMGVRAIRIVCLMNFLLGLIIAMLSSAQVSSFGLSIYVADLIMIGFARELAAIMTATVVSARTGASIAAELATMKVQEEIDALRGMGLNVSQYLVAPRMAALVLVLPSLMLMGLLSGLAGGAIWGVFVLGFRPSVWMQQTMQAAHLSDMLQGMLKTIVFSVFIVLIGCHNGLRVKGGSRGVGLMTTRAVVMDIFMMITVDIIFASIFYYAIKY